MAKRAIIPRHLSSGRALWGLHAAWVTALDSWERAGIPGRLGKGLRGIEFDKLAHLIHLLWNALAERKLVSFGSTYRSSPGVHGPGPALSKRDAPHVHVHALDAISLLQKQLQGNVDIRLFALEEKKYKGRTQYRVHPGRELTYRPLHLLEYGQPAFQGEDQHYLNMICDLIVPLTASEIRALGTHQTEAGTLEAIEYNCFIHVFGRLVRVLNDPGREQEWIGAQYIPTLIDEIERKSSANRKDYARAYSKLEESAARQNSVASLALETIFDPTEEIWTSLVLAWHERGRILADLYVYFNSARTLLVGLRRMVSASKDDGKTEELEEAEMQGRDASARISRKVGVRLPPLPDGTQDEYEWNVLRARTIEIFRSFGGQSRYWQVFEIGADALTQVGVAN